MQRYIIFNSFCNFAKNFPIMKKILVLLSLLMGLMPVLRPQSMPRVMPGDTIAIVAPSAKVDTNNVMPMVRYLQAQGFYVIVPDELYADWNGFAGMPDSRAALFQSMLDRPGVKVILCARGGYGAVTLLDQLDFSRFRQHPKWICGFSDITALHSHLQTLGFPTLHCMMPVTFHADQPDDENTSTMLAALRGDTLRYTFDTTANNRSGQATAELVGGNLSLLYSLLESSSSINTEGKILYIEDVDENIYHIHRMMVALDRAGKLRNLKGLIVGGMTRIRFDDYYADKTVNEVVMEICGKYDYPVCFNFPAGHCKRNLALRLGCTVTLSVTPEGCSLISLPE